MPDIVQQFELAMVDVYNRAKFEAKYVATEFFRMIHERGGLPTAKYLINKSTPSDGYTALYERGRLDLTVEAVVVEEERWHVLFSDDEVVRARQRLAKYGYKPVAKS